MDLEAVEIASPGFTRRTAFLRPYGIRSMYQPHLMAVARCQSDLRRREVQCQGRTGCRLPKGRSGRVGSRGATGREPLLLQFALKTGLTQEIEKCLAQWCRQSVCEDFCQAIDTNQPLDIGQILCAMAPNAAGDLELDEGVQGWKPEPGDICEGAGIRWRIHDGTLR